MSQADLASLGVAGDVGNWTLATDEPGFYGRRWYWKSSSYVLVANQNTGSFAVYTRDDWNGALTNDPVYQERDLENALSRATEWLLAHPSGRDIEGGDRS
ncbi:hypothetical protein [Halapricum hydrolyticum]|uniref:Lactonase family protein n=1 Tax=Halapricum hydrolyticum TaxID=2979991 RepID=A0AAE3I9L9_9EURY|nr:hypothetical protein [Halapricum hydrolyticum]MCU4716821.1 lactonase family protein [Halapricum hydrolyticum]MCU4725574.1 lactonase family protein [Halapricum hydrolyticum]